MRTKEYVVFIKKIGYNVTILPKQTQMGQKVKFLVNKKFAKDFRKLFPRKGIGHAHMYLADFISVDGVIIKNVL